MSAAKPLRRTKERLDFLRQIIANGGEKTRFMIGKPFVSDRSIAQMKHAGLITTEGDRRVTFRITDAGRAWWQGAP